MKKQKLPFRILKIIEVKAPTLFLAILSILWMFGMCFYVGFEFSNEDLGHLTLTDLQGPSYGLMLSGLIISLVGALLFLVSTFFDRWVVNYDKKIWKNAIFFLTLGMVFWSAGEAYFAINTPSFTEIFSQLTFGASLGMGILYVVLTIALATIYFFFKEKEAVKKDDSKEDIKVIQVNPRFRLFLLIFFHWSFAGFIVAFPPCFALIPFFHEYFYVGIIIFFLAFFIFSFPYFLITGNGIDFLPKEFREHYLKKNNQQLQKIKNLEITNVGQRFNVIPICEEAYSEYQRFDCRTKEEFVGLSWIEQINNRLVVNGTIEDLDFSWGVVTKAKKNTMKVFFLAIWYFGPFLGIFIGSVAQKYVNIEFLLPSIWVGNSVSRKYKKFGTMDLFPAAVGKKNSENYLIFSAKLKEKYGTMVFTPKEKQNFTNFDNEKYHWPVNLSAPQKKKLQNLFQEMSFIPKIYLYNNNLSIIVKKYDYNVQDNQELQTWELLKEEKSDNEIQFEYLNQAIKIYQIFNQKEG